MQRRILQQPWFIPMLMIVWGLLGLAACGSQTAEVTSHDLEHASTHAISQHALHASTTTVQRLIVLGDSVSAGAGALNTRLGYAPLLYQNQDDAFPIDKTFDLWHYFGPQVTYINIAHHGDTTDHVVQKQLPRLISNPEQDTASLQSFPVHGHTVVVMTIGGNDIRKNLSNKDRLTQDVLQNALENLRTVVQFFNDRQKFPDGASIYLGTIYDVTDGQDSAYACLPGLIFPGLSGVLNAWAQAYHHFAKQEHVHEVDVYQHFLGHGFHYASTQNPYFNQHDPTLWISNQDCLHPNQRGHQEIRKLFFAKITRANML